MGYIVSKAVRNKVKAAGKQVGTDALLELEIRVECIIRQAIKLSGGHKRITATEIKYARG